MYFIFCTFMYHKMFYRWEFIITNLFTIPSYIIFVMFTFSSCNLSTFISRYWLPVPPEVTWYCRIHMINFFSFWILKWQHFPILANNFYFPPTSLFDNFFVFVTVHPCQFLLPGWVATRYTLAYYDYFGRLLYCCYISLYLLLL